MITFNAYTALITIVMLAPIIGTITLFSLLAFEHEIDFLKNENTRVQLEKELQESEYLQLNQQIQPHFLFNTMNLILGLARLKKNEQLIEVLEQLSLFLKFKYQIKEQLIPFSQELDYTKHFLAIQQIRMGKRLSISYEINENENLDVLIPPYLLQTLVENSFKHSLEKKAGNVHLVIKFRTVAQTALLEVIDDGVGIIQKDFDLHQSSGHGLRNIYNRLSLLFGDDFTISLESLQTKGVRAFVQWPILENSKATES